MLPGLGLSVWKCCYLWRLRGHREQIREESRGHSRGGNGRSHEENGRRPIWRRSFLPGRVVSLVEAVVWAEAVGCNNWERAAKAAAIENSAVVLVGRMIAVPVAAAAAVVVVEAGHID